MKVRTTILVGAGAVSGLLMAVAGPAGAVTAPGKAPAAGCTTLGLSGEITSGQDAGTQISGALCVTDNPFIGTVSGSVTSAQAARLNPQEATAASVSLPAASIPVRGLVFERRAMDFVGSEQVSADQANTAAPAYRAPASRTVLEFDISQGQAVTGRFGVSPDLAIARQAVSYSGTFEGLRLGDRGTWSASPDNIYTAPPAN